MSTPWVMAGSMQDDTIEIREEEELKLIDMPHGSDLRGNAKRCQSRSQSPRVGSSVMSAPSLALYKADVAPDSGSESLVDSPRLGGHEDAILPSLAPELGPPAWQQDAPQAEEKSGLAKSGTKRSRSAPTGRRASKGQRSRSPSPLLRKVSAPPPENCEDSPDPFEGELPEPALHSFLPANLLCVLALLGIFAAAFAGSYNVPAKEGPSPATIMFMHSAKHLNVTEGVSKASLAVLQDKLQLKQMQVDLDTQVFTATQEAAKDFILSTCNLPEKICGSMVAAVGTSDIKFHKKSSVPLDSNTGSYYGVWMWVKQVGEDGDVQVAFKAASLSYQLRDVVTYRDKVEDEPVIKCETLTNNLWFIRGTKEVCREVARKRTVTPLPVFKQSIMNPEEMQLVDTLMESMLAKKVLENANIDGAQAPQAGAAVELGFKGGQ